MDSGPSWLTLHTPAAEGLQGAGQNRQGTDMVPPFPRRSR